MLQSILFSGHMNSRILIWVEFPSSVVLNNDISSLIESESLRVVDSQIIELFIGIS